MATLHLVRGVHVSLTKDGRDVEGYRWMYEPVFTDCWWQAVEWMHRLWSSDDKVLCIVASRPNPGEGKIVLGTCWSMEPELELLLADKVRRMAILAELRVPFGSWAARAAKHKEG